MLQRLLLAMCVLIACPKAWGQLTLAHCQERAQQNHPMIAQYDLVAKTAEFNITNANKAYLPHVSLTGIGGYIISGLPSFGPPGTGSSTSDKFKFIGIGQVNQAIWDGGATAARKDVIRAGAAVDSASLAVDLYRIRERVDQLFFGVLVTDAQLAQLDLSGSTLQRGLDKAQLTKDNGLAYRSDVDEVQAELLKLGQRRMELTYTRSGYVRMLAYMIGEAIDTSVVFQRPPAREDVAAAPNQRPELGSFTAQRQLANAQRELGKTSLMPQFGLMGAGLLIAPPIGLGASDLSSVAIAGLSLSWNTTGLYRNANDRQLHELKLARIANQERSFLFTNGLELQQDDEEVRKARAILAADDRIVTLKARIREACQLKYDNGMASMNELINAITSESEAKSNKALHEIQLLLSQQHYATDNGN